MLQPAIKFKQEIERLQYETWFSEKFKYWNADLFYDNIEITEDTWNKHQFVSVYDGQVIGYIEYDIARNTRHVRNISILNFSCDPRSKAVFGADLYRAIKDIFELYKFRKIQFSIIIGNPVEQSYDRLVHRLGGRIIGVYKDDVVLIDGQYYDRKLYEICASEYFDKKRRVI